MFEKKIETKLKEFVDIMFVNIGVKQKKIKQNTKRYDMIFRVLCVLCNSMLNSLYRITEIMKTIDVVDFLSFCLMTTISHAKIIGF